MKEGLEEGLGGATGDVREWWGDELWLTLGRLGNGGATFGGEPS